MVPTLVCNAKVYLRFSENQGHPLWLHGGRKPEIIVSNNLGSCSGKHILLNHLFIKLGLQSKIMTCLHHFDHALPFFSHPQPRHRVGDNQQFRQVRINNFGTKQNPAFLGYRPDSCENAR